MTMKAHARAMESGWWLALLGLGFLGLAVLETIATTRYRTVDRHDRPVRIAAGEPAWQLQLRRADEALEAKDVRAAERALREAYTAAFGSRRWEGLVEVGDAALRLGADPASRQAAVVSARRAYLAALLEARRQRSVAGALRASEAFAALGDRAVAAEAFRVAEALAARTGGEAALRQIREAAARRADRAVARTP